MKFTGMNIQVTNRACNFVTKIIYNGNTLNAKLGEGK